MAVKRAKTRATSKSAGAAPGPARRGTRAAATPAAKKVAKPAASRTARKTATKSSKKVAKKPAPPTLQEIVLHALADMKAIDVKALDVRGLTDFTDTMVVASGTSDRHVKSIADRVVQRCKEAGFRPYGMEGESDGEWVLVDLHDVVLHVMLPRTRQFYALEKLWETGGATA
jgi:ribosome silencing factor RsfS/YbeB/iojap